MNGHIMEGVRHEWTNYGLTYAMNGQIMEGVRHEWTNYGLTYAMNGHIMEGVRRILWNAMNGQIMD